MLHPSPQLFYTKLSVQVGDLLFFAFISEDPGLSSGKKKRSRSLAVQGLSLDKDFYQLDVNLYHFTHCNKNTDTDPLSDC